MALEAGRGIAERGGLPALTARAIAAEIGYSPGTLYNLFEDLDDLIVHLNADTLDRLYDAVSAAEPGRSAEDALMALARAYIRYTSANRSLWALLFEHRMPEGRALPAWYEAKVSRLIGLVDAALAPLYPRDDDAPARRRAAAVLWSALHGICTLTLSDKMALIETAPAEELAETLVRTFVNGALALSGDV